LRPSVAVPLATVGTVALAAFVWRVLLDPLGFILVSVAVVLVSAGMLRFGAPQARAPAVILAIAVSLVLALAVTSGAV
jgi:predicted membrane chloride channel (bestrophin family)